MLLHVDALMVQFCVHSCGALPADKVAQAAQLG